MHEMSPLAGDPEGPSPLLPGGRGHVSRWPPVRQEAGPAQAAVCGASPRAPSPSLRTGTHTSAACKPQPVSATEA